MVTRASLTAAWMGPLVAQVAIGILVRPPEFFRPINFALTSLVTLVLVGPGSVLLGMASAEIGGHLVGRAVSPTLSYGVACLLGIVFGLLHYEFLSLILHSPRTPLGPEELLTLPSVKMALCISGVACAVQAVWHAVNAGARWPRFEALRAPSRDQT